MNVAAAQDIAGAGKKDEGLKKRQKKEAEGQRRRETLEVGVCAHITVRPFRGIKGHVPSDFSASF